MSKFVQSEWSELTYHIIGSAMAVHRDIGPGHKEAIYQRALEQKLREEKLTVSSQKSIEVTNDGTLVGLYFVDLLVEDKIVVELKALNRIENNHVQQVIAYLAATGCPLGLLLNFGTGSLQTRRIFPPKNVSAYLINQQWLRAPEWMRPSE